MSAVALGRADPDSRELSRWGLSFAAVLGLHALALAGLASYRSTRIEPGEALPAVMIDMAPPPSGPVAAPSAEPPREAAPEATAPEPIVDAPPDVPEPEMAPPREPEPAPAPAPVAVQPPESPPPPDVPPPVRESAAVALPPPPPASVVPPRPKPVERKVQPPKPAPKPVEERRPPKPAQARRGEQQEARRPPAQAAGAQATASVPSASSGSSAASRASWQGALVAHLRRNLRPQGGQTGVASVRFAVDRSGRVLSASLAGSAGSATLDEEAVAVFRRSQPLPAPPSDVPGASFTFTVPIRFSTR